MKKNLGVVPAVYPMPVLMVAAYDEAGTVNVMNAAWGMICAMDKIALFIDEDHKTTQNLLKTKAFTVSIADRGFLRHRHRQQDARQVRAHGLSRRKEHIRQRPRHRGVPGGHGM